MKNKYVMYGALLLLGYVLKDQIAKVPGVNKLPTV